MHNSDRNPDRDGQWIWTNTYSEGTARFSGRNEFAQQIRTPDVQNGSLNVETTDGIGLTMDSQSFRLDGRIAEEERQTQGWMVSRCLFHDLTPDRKGHV
jgi:hypothetical protein